MLVAWAVVPIGASLRAQTPEAPAPIRIDSLVIGETFTIASTALHETRRINVYLPPGYRANAGAALPVLYMPDGGMAEDFLHVSGLVQVSVGNATMRPFILVGIENTERRRDLTGPTTVESDKKIAARVGGSQAFRDFIRSELIPVIEARYRTTGERAIVGESLAGLFVVETFFREPDLFDEYLAFDPSLWWNDESLLKGAKVQLQDRAREGKTLYLANRSEPQLAKETAQLAAILQEVAPQHVRWYYVPYPDETHGTIYHPAALRAFRTVFAPAPVKK
jgi:predicted alpha/beta superfamily hydrolase